MKRKLEDLSKKERSLLLYIETRAVDHRSFLDMTHINSADHRVGEEWNESGFVKYRRATLRDFNGDVAQLTYEAILSDEAWQLVGELRKERARHLRSEYDKRLNGIADDIMKK